MNAEATEIREVVYLGRRALKGGKVGYAAMKLGRQAGEHNEEGLYKKRPFAIPSYAMPGQVYAITFVAGGDEFYTSGPNAPKFVRLFPDAEYRAGWEAQDRAAEAVVDSGKEARSADGGIAELCRPLSRVYAKATPFERAALLVRIIAEVQGGAR